VRKGVSRANTLEGTVVMGVNCYKNEKERKEEEETMEC